MVVVSFITKNSASKLRETPISLNDVLKSTLQVPYRSIILVDNSTDDTVEWFRRFCDEHGKELVLIRGGKTRGEARQIAVRTFLENFSDTWLMFVDDDVVLNDGWWSEASQYVDDPKVGIIWGLNYDSEPTRHIYLKALGVDYVRYLIQEFFHRGGTHDTLLRREAIVDLEIPPDLHWYEDGYILRHVLSKGYEARIVYTGCIHYNPWGERLKWREIREMARIAVRYGFEKPSVRRLVRSLGSIIPHLYSSVRVYGLRRGVKRAFNRWITKVLFRLALLLEDLSSRL